MNLSANTYADETNPYVWATIDEHDLAIFTRNLQDFVPPGSFDAYAHLWRVADQGTPTPSLTAAVPPEVTRAVYNERVRRWMPERCPTGGLFFRFPTRALNVDSANGFLAAQLKIDPNSRGLMIVTPQHDAASVECQVVDDGFVGFNSWTMGP